MKNYKKSMMLIMISIGFILVVLIAFSYAYFSAVISGTSNNIDLNVELPNALYNFNTSTDAQITLNITYEDMMPSDSGTDVFKNTNADYVVSLNTFNDNSNVLCTYDLVWVWNSLDQYIVPTQSSTDESYKEFTISGSSETLNDGIIDNNSIYSVNAINETNLSNFTWKNSDDSIIDTSTSYTLETGSYATILTGAKISHNGIGISTTNWNFNVNIYNLSANQNALLDKNYLGVITTKNINCSSN